MQLAESGLACQDNFSRYKDEEHNSWLHHPIDETRKQLWFVAVHNKCKCLQCSKMCDSLYLEN